MHEIHELADCCIADATFCQYPMRARGLAKAKVSGRSDKAANKGPQPIQIKLQMMGGERHVLSADPTSTLLSIKLELEALVGIDAHEQQVYLADDDANQLEHGLPNNMLVREILAKAGGAAADGNFLALVLVRADPASILSPALAEEVAQEMYHGVISAAELGVLAHWAKQLVDMPGPEFPERLHTKLIGTSGACG